jgi:hypothetical protein
MLLMAWQKKKLNKRMEDLKIYFLNIGALAISITEVNPYLQSISLLLAIGYTIIKITQKLNGKD